MARSKNDEQTSDAGAEVGLDEVQRIADAEHEQGFVGTKVDPLPNEAYSQETDPTTSPGILDAQRAGAADRDRQAGGDAA